MPGNHERDGELLLDLRGVRCPLAWAKAKVHLETLAPGAQIALLIDDPRSLRDLPRAAEANGHHVIRIDDNASPWRIVLEV
jgi:TusA-related sulfurtransferase